MTRQTQTYRRCRAALAGPIVVLLSVMCLTAHLAAGVLVAPTVVIMSDQNRTGRLTLENPGNTPKEIEVSFGFGLPWSDSLGNVSISIFDDDGDDPRSALGWVRAFPRRVVLPPNGSQVVRLVAQPPEDLPDGEYWAHVIIKSQEGQTSLPVESEDITTRLNMIMRTVIALKYRTGDLSSAVALNGVDTAQNDDNVHFILDLENKGNVSYLGVLNARLLDADNREIVAHKSNLAVYRDLTRGVTMPITADDFKRPFVLDISISSEGRTDIPRSDMILGNNITQTIELP